MKNTVKLGLVSLLAASSTAFSAMPSDEGWYAGLMGELSYAPNLDFSISQATYLNINSYLSSLGYSPLLTPAGQIDYSKIGGGGGAQIGYRNCNFRFEGELLYNYNSYDSVSLGGYTLTNNVNAALVAPYSNLTIDGNTTLGAALFNIYYDFYDQNWDDISWMPYVGLGIGYGYLQNKLQLNYNTYTTTSTGSTTTTTVTTTNIIDVKENTSTPVGQAILGVSYLFNDNFSMGLDYRYVTTKEISGFNDRFTIHTLNLNFNYWFNSDA
ncbi:outer membrane protein [Legionella cardiaca]|uniref:Outer membrane beta-barrel protein n=1 Tax=Legionella cardiaca TaxID=1071983 RepID=A0ABY8ARP2_9GAMM|nr:outer membrane beta-barrel protein [Legionella cardiaca]WED41946.1 outer membrane beta-barrel protein [Legionella cardiaca]